MAQGIENPSDKFLSSKEKFLLHFMSTVIEKINTCYATQHALQMLLIRKGIATTDEIIAAIKESKALPQRRVGHEALAEMVRNDRIDDIISLMSMPDIDSKKPV